MQLFGHTVLISVVFRRGPSPLSCLPSTNFLKNPAAKICTIYFLPPLSWDLLPQWPHLVGEKTQGQRHIEKCTAENRKHINENVYPWDTAHQKSVPSQTRIRQKRKEKLVSGDASSTTRQIILNVSALSLPATISRTRCYYGSATDFSFPFPHLARQRELTELDLCAMHARVQLLSVRNDTNQPRPCIFLPQRRFFSSMPAPAPWTKRERLCFSTLHITKHSFSPKFTDEA